MSSTLEHDPRLIAEQSGLRGLLSDYRRRMRQGDIGQLPVIVGLIVISTVFEVATGGIFLTPFNLVNMTLQMSAVGTIAIGLVLVLLLGEIDLSAGIVSGLCAAIMAVLSVRYELSAPVALGLALLCGAAVGGFHGAWATGFGVPTFVVTLAGLLGWQGALLAVLGKTGTINVFDRTIVALAGTFLHGVTAYVAGAVFIAYVAIAPLLDRRRRAAAGLAVQPLSVVAVRAAAVSICVIVAVVVLDADRGISSALLFLIGAILVMDFVLRRVRLGRMIYAVGGNAEAARRAGIPVRRVRIAVFVLASLFSAWGGILGASRLFAVNQSAGGGPVLLNAIAAAVIGGTSLFGGRGTVWSALFGILVIQSISSGMDLLSLDPSIKYMVTGAVLLVTATIDAVLRRSGTAPRT